MHNNALSANRPNPIDCHTKTKSFNRHSDSEAAIQTLLQGEYVVIDEFYSDGLFLLQELKAYLKNTLPNHSFIEQRAFRSAFKKSSNNILILIQQHKLQVKKAPVFGWLEKLYSDCSDFFLPLPQIQGLNSSWQWYKNGIQIPGLRNKIHPYYGVYFPTRFEHLILFDHWLKRYQGAKKTAIDVGIGSGVLSLLMVQRGFQKIYGTDINPNAIIGMAESMAGTKLAKKIEIDLGHLFGTWEQATELIVFNPPWLPATQELSTLDEAIYYDEHLFPDFFEAAHKRLLPEGKIVIIFSNIATITQVANEHPIEKELIEGKRFELEKCYKKSVQEASKKTTRNLHWRGKEEVELWVLKHMSVIDFED